MSGDQAFGIRFMDRNRLFNEHMFAGFKRLYPDGKAPELPKYLADAITLHVSRSHGELNNLGNFYLMNDCNVVCYSRCKWSDLDELARDMGVLAAFEEVIEEGI